MAACLLLGSVTACSTTETSPPPTAEDSLTDRAEASATATPDDAEQTSSAPTDAGEDPGVPKLPEAATEDTEDGANAFSQYYIELVSHLDEFPTDYDIGALASESCLTCEAFEERIDLFNANGSHMDGPTARVTNAVSSRTDTGAITFVELVELSAVQIDAEGATLEAAQPEQSTELKFTLTFKDSRWLVDGIQNVAG